jgi:hypothetical protein
MDTDAAVRKDGGVVHFWIPSDADALHLAGPDYPRGSTRWLADHAPEH